MNRQLEELLGSTRHADNERQLRTSRIRHELLSTSRFLNEPNFTRFHAQDIRQLFDLYDRYFFSGLLRGSLAGDPISFRLSRRMTRAGGKTTRWAPLHSGTPRRYEIAISATLLFETFADVQRSIQVTGIRCHNRLDALMRIMEHELVHLGEMLVWEKSNCSKQPFQSIAGRFFGHTDHRHELVSPRERAAKQLGLRPGSRVHFEFEGRRLEGIVNRVTRRATVLVRDPRGQPYSDGQRYSKFYIPLGMLEVVGQ
ncbi:MAG: hypothetical protein R3C19_14560 [Planctomycetaceae bacterium]